VRRITEVVQNIEGLALDICLSGRQAALHISTTKGRVVIRLPRSEVVDKYITGRDSNGTPFVASGTVMERLVQDAEITAPIGDAAAPRARLPHGEVARICREHIWPALVANPLQNVAQLAEAHGLKPGSVTGWINDNHPGGVATLRGAEVHIPRAVGDAAKAAQGLPITKPGAKSL
jgi:hypothetical protein